MSAKAMRWLGRQCVADSSLLMVLQTLTKAANTSGKCSITQKGIAAETGLSDRTVRTALLILERTGVIIRKRHSSGRKGRIADIIQLDITQQVDLSRAAIASLRKMGASGKPLPVAPMKTMRVQPETGFQLRPVAPTLQKTKKKQCSVPNIEHDSNRSANKNRHISGRTWIERRRLCWRATLRVDGRDFHIGRYISEEEARCAVKEKLAEIEHALSNPAGTPLNPISRADIEPMQDLGSWLFGEAEGITRCRKRTAGETEARPADTEHWT